MRRSQFIELRSLELKRRYSRFKNKSTVLLTIQKGSLGSRLLVAVQLSAIRVWRSDTITEIWYMTSRLFRKFLRLAVEVPVYPFILCLPLNKFRFLPPVSRSRLATRK